AATKLVLVSSTTSTQAGTAVTYTATIEDANGNTVTSPDHQVAFAVSGVSGSFSPSASIASSDGVAVCSFTPSTAGAHAARRGDGHGNVCRTHQRDGNTHCGAGRTDQVGLGSGREQHASRLAGRL